MNDLHRAIYVKTIAFQYW